VYDMVKSADRFVTINGIRLLEKSGGKSGHWKRPAPKTSADEDEGSSGKVPRKSSGKSLKPGTRARSPRK
jgi:hypothetical protein